jgi:dephospho-CoA kinase
MTDATLPSLEKRYSKALCHLNNARRTSRLGLILGSGVSEDLKIPKWRDLVDAIDAELGYDSSGAPESHRAEQQFQHYKINKTAELIGWHPNRIAAAVTSGWREVVASRLYSNFPGAIGSSTEAYDASLEAYNDSIKKHPYLMKLGKLAQSARLVVTHNFDDALEVAIGLDSSSRRSHSFWKPEPFLLPEVVSVYHPNGYTPLRRTAKGSESLILTEASFADHLANTNTEEAHYLLRHLADKTFLIVGHSLADGTLKNALRQHANQHPGHVNYFLYFHKDGEAGLSEVQRRAIRQANFETYNLITIFANSPDIAEILRLVAMEEKELEGHLLRQSVKSRYVYYFVGAVSSGKSTALRHLRNFFTVEEWPRDMPPVMNRQSVGLDAAQKREIDVKLEDAIWQKNTQVRDVIVGIVAVDRAPLDFIAFPTQKDEVMQVTAQERATAVLDRLQRNEFKDLCEGQVVVVQADPEMLVERQLQRSGRTKPEEVKSGETKRYLEHQRGCLGKIYAKSIADGSVVESGHCIPGGAAKDAARIIHFEEYRPFDFVSRLRAIQSGEE